jgi:hypothetical protein
VGEADRAGVLLRRSIDHRQGRVVVHYLPARRTFDWLVRAFLKA